jgi:hypothetical protein
MSAIAEFIRLPANALEKLREDYFDTVDTYGESVAEYDWSGYVIATLLPYLDEKGISLTKSPFKNLAHDLYNAQGISLEILTPAHKEAFLEMLSPEAYSKDDLRDYFNEFNAAQEPDEVGQAMLDGIAAIRTSLDALDADSVILLHIG